MEKEHEVEGLLELPQVHREAGNREFFVASLEDIEEEEDEEEIDHGSTVSDSFEKIVPSVLRKRLQTKEVNPADSTNASIELANSVKRNLSMYKSRDSSTVCIYKVPAKLRKVNEKAYTPLIVSIGPIHHGRPELQDMERSKWRFLDRYLEATSVTIDLLVKMTMDMELKVRECYQEPFDHLSSKEFSEMIMLDGIYVTMLCKEDREKKKRPEAVSPSKRSQESTKLSPLDQEPWAWPELSIDPLPAPLLPTVSLATQISQNQWVRSEIIHDLMLLENQLPFFVLQNFHKYLGESYLKIEESIPRFFRVYGNFWRLQDIEKPDKVRHLLDIVRDYYKPKHPRIGGKIVYNRSATELQEAGVTFTQALRSDIFDIKFRKGRLEVPKLRIHEFTETIFRNMIAFEQCHYNATKDITSYVIFMDSLIDTTKDVDLLAGLGIIQNNYGDHERVATLFNNLHKESVVSHEDDFCFTSLCTELNEYSKDWWHQWKAKWFRSKKVLRRDYFGTPWSTLSVIAAIILLVLTIVQTVCSIVSIL